MKRYILFAFLAFIMMAFLCSFSKPKTFYEDKTGSIRSFGNEPFAFLGFVTEEGEAFTLKLSSEHHEIPESYTALTDVSDFSALTGNKISFLGEIKKAESDSLGYNQLKDGTFYVFAYKIIA